MNQARSTRHTIRRRFLLLGFATIGFSPVGSQLAHAASAAWNAAPTNGIWEAAGSENNWSTGAATFPGSTAGTTTNTDVATFNAVSTGTAISIDSTAGNALSLNLGAIGFTGAAVSNYTIGSTTGNALVMTSNATQASTTNQIFISGGGRSSATSAILETINSPIVLAPQSSTTAGFYVFQNNSTVLSSGDRLVVNGPISGGTTTSTVALTLLGANTNVGNVVNGAISNGGAAGGLQLFKNNVGTWTLAGNNSYTGTTTVSNGNLRITGNYTGGGNVDMPTGGATGGITVATAGTVTFGNVVLNGGNAFFTINSGTVTVGQISETALSASRHVDVNGGLLRITADYGALPGVLNVNGGTIANAKSGGATLTIDSLLTNSTTVHSINIGANGATFDTTAGGINSLATLNGGAGTVNVVGGNTLKAGATLTGTMAVQGASTWDINGIASSMAGLSGSGSVTNSGAAATLTSNLAGTQTYAGSISGDANVSLVKSGAGTQVLSGTHSYTGNTTINAGALVVTGALTTSPVTVNSGGSLGGTGDGTSTGALGNVVLAAGGTLAPGAGVADGSVGTLVIGNLDANNGNTRFDLVTPGASDRINAGAATFSSANTFTLVGLPTSGTYTLVQSSTALGGAAPTLVVPTGTRATYTPHYGDVDPNAFQLVVAGSPKSLTWTGANGNVWDVTGAFNWTDGAISEQFFNLDAITFDNAGANKSIALDATVQPASATFNNDTGNDYTVSGTGAIAGLATTLTKSGSGTLVLATNNTYGGGTTISAGALQVGNGGTAGSLGSGTVTNNAALVFNRSDTNTLSVPVNGTGSLRQSGAGTLVITSSNNYSGTTTIDAGTTLQLGDGGTTGNLGSTGGVTDNGTLTYNRTNAHTLNAVISGSGNLVVNSGTLSLGGNNSYTGTTTINAGGTLQIGSGGTSGSAGTGPITNDGTLAFNRSDNISPASFSGGGAIQQNGTGTLIFAGPSTYTGPTIVNNGTVAGLHANAFGSTPNIIVAAAGTLSLRGDASTTFTRVSDGQPYTIQVNASGATLNADQATVAGTSPKTMTIGPITATTTAVSFTLNFTGANNTSLSVGAINGPAATQGFATTTINNFNTSGTTTIDSYTGNNTVGNETVSFAGNGNTAVTNGISDPPSQWPLGISKTGGGTLTLNGASSYSNGTVIAAGVVAIGNDGAFGIGPVNLNAADGNAVLQSADGTTRTIANDITNSSTNFTFGGNGDLVFNGTWNKGQFFKNLIVNTPTMTINGAVVSNPGANQAFSKEGTGTLILAGANTYTGDTLVRQGTLTVAPTGSLGDNTFGLEVSNNNTTVPGTTTVINLSTVSDTTVGNLSGFISAPTSGVNTATINTGGSGLNFTVNQTAALTAPAGIAGAGNFVLGSGSTNTLTLTGNLSYSGTTTVNAGTLRLQTNLTGTSAVNVSNATLEVASGGGSNRVLRASSVSITGTGKIDLRDNKLITDTPAGTFDGTSYSGIQGEIQRAYNFGAWDQPGLMTSEENAGQNAGPLSGTTTIGVATAEQVLFIGPTDTTVVFGQTVTGATTIAMYTYAGDVNFDGLVDGADYGTLDNWIQFPGTDGYANGDVNYDGVIDGADYGVLDNSIQLQGDPFPGVFSASGSGASASLSGVTAVPEPAGIIATGLATFGLFARRRRHGGPPQR